MKSLRFLKGSRHLGSKMRFCSSTSNMRKSTKVSWGGGHGEGRGGGTNPLPSPHHHPAGTFSPANHFLSPKKLEKSFSFPGSCSR